MELVLGTAQFAENYGIANSAGQPSQQKATAIVRAAVECGISSFDTAQDYDNSEAILGKALRDNGYSKQAKVITKLTTSLPPQQPQWVREQVLRSIRKLGVERLEGVMLHCYDWLGHLSGELGEQLRSLQQEGLVNKLGISVYNVEELQNSAENKFVEIVQLPCNPWDSRFLIEKWLLWCAKKGVDVFVRSLFLQGLLLMPHDAVVQRFPRAEAAHRQWLAICKEYGVSPYDLCLRFANTLDCPVLIGAETPEQVQPLAKARELPPLSSEEISDLSGRLIPLLDETIINPTKWDGVR